MRAFFIFLLFGFAHCQSVTLVAAGDIACNPEMVGTSRPDLCASDETAALVGRLNPDLVLLLGDVQYERGSLTSFEQVYDASWGAFKNMTYPAPGNHDYYTPHAAGYYAYFGARAGERGKGYYSFELGNWNLIALNSNCVAVGGCGAGSPQESWLRAVLAESDKSCTLAFWHHPRFSSGKHGSDSLTADFWRALQMAGAELVLSGHDHNYERFGPQDNTGGALEQGPRQFVVGTGGRSLREVERLAAHSEHVEVAFGVLRLELLPQRYRWSFITTDGETLDSGEADCYAP